MPLPIVSSIGALIGAILPGTTPTLFAIVLRAINRTVSRVGDSILDGLVSGSVAGPSGEARHPPTGRRVPSTRRSTRRPFASSRSIPPDRFAGSGGPGSVGRPLVGRPRRLCG
jgi:hypothetical protein